jgi:hypothetical protein
LSIHPGSIAISPNFRTAAHELGLTAARVFDDPQIIVWRDLPDRQNCTWTFDHHGHRRKWHVKRYRGRRAVKAMLSEVAGLELLKSAGVPTLDMVAHGTLDESRALIITDDLGGYVAGDKYLATGVGNFEQILVPTARLAALLHSQAPRGADLHHRDLYLCHFFIRATDPSDIRLIDVARVRELPWFFRQRWVVKDLAQFIYSTYEHDISDLQRRAWLAEYAAAAGQPLAPAFHAKIYEKVRRIGRHDAHLRQRQPGRNISIPQ